MTLLAVARAIEDSQYGFGAILNNLPLLVQAMGGTPDDIAKIVAQLRGETP